jgi:hypothetical protein
MQAVVSLAFLFRGLSAANRGAELLANIAKREVEEAAREKRRQERLTRSTRRTNHG